MEGRPRRLLKAAPTILKRTGVAFGLGRASMSLFVGLDRIKQEEGEDHSKTRFGLRVGGGRTLGNALP